MRGSGHGGGFEDEEEDEEDDEDGVERVCQRREKVKVK